MEIGHFKISKPASEKRRTLFSSLSAIPVRVLHHLSCLCIDDLQINKREVLSHTYFRVNIAVSLCLMEDISRAVIKKLSLTCTGES